MNIFYDGMIFIQRGYGGISRYFMELVSRMMNWDDLNLFLFRFPDLFEKQEGVILQKRIKAPANIPKIGGILRRIDSVRLPSLVRDFDSDIYHTSSYRIPKGIKAFKVVTVYDMIHEKLLKEQKSIEWKRVCIERADKIIAISESTKRDILEYINIPEEKITVTYLAASTLFQEATEDEKCELRRKYHLSKPFILYVGCRDRYKNFAMLLRAYSRWSERHEFDLICIGGANKFPSDENKVIRRTNLANSVRLFTGINDNELRRFYSSALAFVCPSLYEGFGIPPLEAMACGAPVIVSNVSSLPEVVGNAGLYFDPTSEDDLLACLNEITNDVELREQLVKKGMDRARLFNWEKTATETYSIYRDLQK